MKVIKFSDSFNKFSIIEKRNYIKKLIKNNSVKSIINSLILNNPNIIENFEIMNSVSSSKEFKSKFKIGKLKVASIMINSYVLNNKTKDLVKYFNALSESKLKIIINNEIDNRTDFSKLKLCNDLYKKIKKEVSYDDNVLVKKKGLNREIKSKKVIGTIFFILALIVIFVGYVLMGYCYYIINFYNTRIYPNTYLNGELISGLNYQELSKKLYDKDIVIYDNLNFINTNNIYTYSYKDIGFYTNKDEIEKIIVNSNSNLNGYQKLYKIFLGGKSEYELKYLLQDDIYNNFINDLKNKVNVEKRNEVFKISGGKINYTKGVNGFSLNDSTLKDDIINSINTSKREIGLSGSVDSVNNNLELINKKVSTFTTYYNESQGRAKNIRNAVSKINGRILYPNETFSFYKAAGPYNGSRGYIFYAKDVGSGVCQVSTTIYNAALLLNLPIISRENHGDMVYYVDYGMDATVYGSYVDMKFKNNSKYPIYIEAHASGGTLTVSLWSNENIIPSGYSYKPRVEQISALGFKTYLDTYYNGNKVSSKFLNSSYYLKGK